MAFMCFMRSGTSTFFTLNFVVFVTVIQEERYAEAHDLCLAVFNHGTLVYDSPL